MVTHNFCGIGKLFRSKSTLFKIHHYKCVVLHWILWNIRKDYFVSLFVLLQIYRQSLKFNKDKKKQQHDWNRNAFFFYTRQRLINKVFFLKKIPKFLLTNMLILSSRISTQNNKKVLVPRAFLSVLPPMYSDPQSLSRRRAIKYEKATPVLLFSISLHCSLM